MAHDQGGAEVAEDRAPTLTCNHEAPIAFLPETAHTLRAEGFDASEGGTGRGTPLVPVHGVIPYDLFQVTAPVNRQNRDATSPCHTLARDNAAHAAIVQPIAFPAKLSGTQCASTEDLAPAMGAKNPTAVATAMQVRRLTPRECERLQGFPDGYTAIPWRKKPASECPDGPRYKALGNSMAVPVMRWIGARIARQVTP